jgi:hypothetical protein
MVWAVIERVSTSSREPGRSLFNSTRDVLTVFPYPCAGGISAVGLIIGTVRMTLVRTA